MGGKAVAYLKSGKRITSDLLMYSVGRMGATACPESRLRRPDLRPPRPYTRQRTLPDCTTPHIRGRRRGGLPLPGLDLNGAGPGRCLSRLWNRVPLLPPPLPLRHLFRTGAIDGRWHRAGFDRSRCPLRGWPRQVPGDSAGVTFSATTRECSRCCFTGTPVHCLGIHIIGAEAAELIHIGQAVLAFRRHPGLLRQHRLQLPHPRRVLQSSRPGLLQQDRPRPSPNGARELSPCCLNTTLTFLPLLSSFPNPLPCPL